MEERGLREAKGEREGKDRELEDRVRKRKWKMGIRSAPTINSIRLILRRRRRREGGREGGVNGRRRRRKREVTYPSLSPLGIRERPASESAPFTGACVRCSRCCNL